MGLQHIQHQPRARSLWFDLSGIRDGEIKRLFANKFAEYAEFRPIQCDFWSVLRRGEVDTLPQNLIVMADLSNIIGAYRRLDSHSWTRAVRKARLSFFALVRSKRDEKYAELIDDVVRASDSRLTVWSLVSQEGIRTDCVKRAIAATHTHSIVDIRYSEVKQCFWIQFGDGLSVALTLRELDLKTLAAELIPETVTVSPEDPETVEFLDVNGENFEVDSRSLRALVDPILAESLQKETDKEIAGVGEVLKRKRNLLDITQEELAKRSGLEQALISKLECGKHEPRFDTLKKYAEGLGLSVAELLEP